MIPLVEALTKSTIRSLSAVLRHLSNDLVERLGGVESAIIEESVHLLDGVNLLGGKTSAVESHGVDTTKSDRVACCDREGRDVLIDLRSALNHTVCANPAELVNERSSADDGKIIYFHFAG